MAEKAASQQKLAVLDTNVLFHLAEQYAPAHNLVLRLVRTGFIPVVTQTVVQELGDASLYGYPAKKRELATIALSSMRSWGIQPTGLTPVGNGICEIVAEVIANRGLLPPEERNDAFTLIEAAFFGASMLITWDGHLLSASQAGLSEVLTSFDLRPVQIVHPRVILGY
jgi:rRNA-processing protein FCF1